MINNKSESCKFFEKLGLLIVLSVIIVNAIVRHDSISALISSVWGITYTFFAGKGLPICYLFGVTGSSFYSYLSWQNLLWGNLLLYACYYVPMQILGFFRWNKNLKEGKNDVVKIRLPKSELAMLLFVLIFLCIVVALVLIKSKDTHPILDSITTVLSIGGMYLTVRRAIEQWIFWFVVNLLSLIMWLYVALSGARVYSTLFMWAVYLFLSVYFYIMWEKELSSQIQ